MDLLWYRCRKCRTYLFSCNHIVKSQNDCQPSAEDVARDSEPSKAGGECIQSDSDGVKDCQEVGEEGAKCAAGITII